MKVELVQFSKEKIKIAEEDIKLEVIGDIRKGERYIDVHFDYGNPDLNTFLHLYLLDEHNFSMVQTLQTLKSRVENQYPYIFVCQEEVFYALIAAPEKAKEVIIV